MKRSTQFVIRGGTHADGSFGVIIEVGGLATKEDVEIIGRSFAQMMLERFMAGETVVNMDKPQLFDAEDLDPNRKQH